MLSVVNLGIIAFVLAVAFFDASSHRIPRVLTTAAFILGLILHVFAGGILSSVFAATTGFCIGLVLFRLGAVGGGDVKLITALGALLGWSQWMHAMYIAVLAAAVIALGIAATQRSVMRTLRNSIRLVRSLLRCGFVPPPDVHVQNPMAVRGPFGVAAAIGTISVLVRP